MATKKATVSTGAGAAGHGPDPHDPDEVAGTHAAADHGGDLGHNDHEHAAVPLGPLDVRAWGAGAVGIALGLVVAVCLGFSSGALG